MEKNIFREYDIRALVGKEMNAQEAELVGKAFGSMAIGDIAVGCDNRESSPAFKENFIKGLLSAGCNVVDIGVVPTPVMYFAVCYYAFDGGVNITASHNPPEYNGFKLCKKSAEPFFGEDIQKLWERIQKKDFRSGQGKLTKRGVIEDYLDCIKNKIRLEKKFKVVVDCGNAVGSLTLPRLLESLGCEVVRLYCYLDSKFPHHLPDPAKAENLKDLIQRVKEEGADLGLGFDGDADRIGVVDRNGRIFYGDDLMVLFAKEILSKKPKAKILFEVKCSQNLYDKILEFGGKPIVWKTGHSLIKDKMKKEDALLAGEMSGHLFFRDEWFGFDDAVYSAARLLRFLSAQEKDIGELLDENKYVSSPEIRVDCPDERKFKIVEELKEVLLKAHPKSITVDGIRTIYPFGWGLVRASNTSPKLILRFEADSGKNLKDIESDFRHLLSKYPEVGVW